MVDTGYNSRFVVTVDRHDQGRATIILWQHLKDGTWRQWYTANGGWDDAIPWSTGVYDGDRVPGLRFANPYWHLDTPFADRFGIQMHAKLGISPGQLPYSYGSFGCIVAPGWFLRSVAQKVGTGDLDFQVRGFNPVVGLSLTGAQSVGAGHDCKLRVNLTGDSTGVSKDCYVAIKQVPNAGATNATLGIDYKLDYLGPDQQANTGDELFTLAGWKNAANPALSIDPNLLFVKIPKGHTFADILIHTMKNVSGQTVQGLFKIVDYYFDSPNTVGGHRMYSDYANPKVLIRNSSDISQNLSITTLQDLANLSITKSGGIEGFSGSYSASKGITYQWHFDAYSIPDTLQISDNTGYYANLSNVSGAWQGSFGLRAAASGIIKIVVAGSASGTAWELSISAGTAKIFVHGSSAHDTTVMIGNEQATVLKGGAEDDFISGGLGHDHLIGRGGSDIFSFDSSIKGASNIDTIKDFSVTDHDKIQLSLTVFTNLLGSAGHTLSNDQFVIGGHAHTRSEHIIYNPDDGRVFYDEDGKGGSHQVQFALIERHLNLHANDFILGA